jgi:hypothetical protein
MAYNFYNFYTLTKRKFIIKNIKDKIDKILINIELDLDSGVFKGNTLSLLDTTLKRGRIPLEYLIPFNSLIYKYFSKILRVS